MMKAVQVGGAEGSLEICVNTYVHIVQKMNEPTGLVVLSQSEGSALTL